MSRRRVFITGLSALTASGATADAMWTSVLAGESAIRPIQQWDLTTWGPQWGGECDASVKKLADRKLMKLLSPQDVLGLNAAEAAILNSRLLNYRDTLPSAEVFNEETGIYVGSPGNKYFQQYDFLPLLAKAGNDMRAFAEQLFSEVHPMWLLRILPNNVLAYTGINYGFKGPNHNVANHGTSGAQALIEAYHAIASGKIQRAVVVAYDIGIEPHALFYYDKLGVLSSRHLKPFDVEHDGTLLAEGAAAIILESASSIEERQGACYAEILGGHATTEAVGLFSIESEGQSLAELLQQTLERTSVRLEDIGLIVAHGNGNEKSDKSEAHAIQVLCGQANIPVTAFKWAMGHTLCASGLIDTVLMNYVLRSKRIPGIANLNHAASGCSALNLSHETRGYDKNKPCALLINRGFAGMNACIAFKACE